MRSTQILILLCQHSCVIYIIYMWLKLEPLQEFLPFESLLIGLEWQFLQFCCKILQTYIMFKYFKSGYFSYLEFFYFIFTFHRLCAHSTTRLCAEKYKH